MPAAAAYFAFAHPPTGIAALSEERIEELTESGLAEPWLHFLVLGGFCYFNDRCELLAVNAITAPGGGNEDPGAAHPEMRTRLSFDGPLPVDGRVLTALRTQGRLHAVTIPGLLAAGAKRYGWLNPRETAGGVPIPLAEAWEHGAFLYEPADGLDAILFRVVEPAPLLMPSRSESERLADELQLPLDEVRDLRAVQRVLDEAP